MSEDSVETQEEVSEEIADSPIPGLADLLSTFPHAPTEGKIDKWKEIHGEIFCSGFSETELVVWRPINRKEYVVLQEQLQAGSELNTYELEERVVVSCILWSTPQAESALDQKAGSLTTLNEQIMQNSNFVNPQMASALVVKL
tara:strand:+ start:524 stop:952 length:429 start_codon:yes stop_codon:yes gene_type:complete